MNVIETTSAGTLIQNIKSGKVYKMWAKPYVSAAGNMMVCYKALDENGATKGPIITSKIENVRMVTRPM